jgi:choline dehydrogenase
MPQRYDYIIIGAGSAGCVLANRLTEDPATSVLVLESGGSDNSIFIKMPTAFSIPMNMKRFNWFFMSKPEPHLDGRRVHCPRGKVIGGSSSINGLVYVRGHAYDFDQWAELGATDWEYRNCLPYFKKSENFRAGGNEYRGGDGPLHTNNGNEMSNPLYGAFVKAGVEAGYEETTDPNGQLQEGFGPMHMTVRNGKRWSAADAYLKPARSRPNLTVISRATTRSIIMENKRAVGVIYQHRGREKTTHCEREVIVSAGPIGSPHLLQCSGIGPTDVLQEAGVHVKHDLPGVGENLQDHPEVYIQFKCKKPLTLNTKMDLFSRFKIGLRWILFRDGLGATNHFEAGGFIRSEKGLRWPDIQYHFLPAAVRYDGKKPVKGHGFMALTGPNKPKSRGYVRITSADISQHPDIQFNYLNREEDREGFRKCVRMTREIMGQPAMEPYVDDEISPGSDVQTDTEIDAYVREALESAYHPCGTCKMGQDDMAVVDPELRVHGIDGLRVVDSSTFPTVTNGNLNAPTMMLAERAADLIRGREPLPASNAEVGLAARWEDSQRPNEPIRKVS